MDPVQGRTVEQLFKDKAATLMKVRSTVSVACLSPEDALTVFNWLEQQICSPQAQPPFPDRCRVRATQDTSAIWFREGDPPDLDDDICMEGNAYRVQNCFWHAEHGWVVQIGEEKFKAADFELAKPAVWGDPPPFADKAVVLCLRSSPDYTAEGWLCDNARCMSGRQYMLETCSLRPDGGWFVEIGGDLHLAEDFRLWDASDASP